MINFNFCQLQQPQTYFYLWFEQADQNPFQYLRVVSIKNSLPQILSHRILNSLERNFSTPEDIDMNVFAVFDDTLQ